MEYIIFKNPRIKYRKERFGGLLRFDLNIFILSKKEYRLLKRINKYILYSSLNKADKIIANKFLENNLLLKLKINRANKIIKRFSNRAN